MTVGYNQVAGRSLERLAALSDGIFAVAMTLLVLDLRVPVMAALYPQQPLWAPGALPSEQALLNAMLPLAPRLLAYLMSFLTLGIFWMGQQTQFNAFQRSDRNLTWIHLLFLLGVTLIPFSTGFLAEYITNRLPMLVYWLNLQVLGVMLFVSWRYGQRAGLMKDEITDEIRTANVRRIRNYQLLYAVGALLSIVNTYISIGFLILLQLNSAFPTRFRLLNRF